MRNPSVAAIVVNALRHFDGNRYQLFSWCVMPNHVHVVFQLMADETLERILHSWKSYSSKKANEFLARSGEFWQREYYDRLIRGEGEFQRAMRYIGENPKKARLEGWPWVWTAIE
jgi:REP element-mobilizing transposase RayT